MKLNHDCVRDLLLYLEENLSLNDHIILNDIKLKEYDVSEIIYTAEKLIEANYIDCLKPIYTDDNPPIILVRSITYQGHQFLDAIRDDGVWKETKSKASKFASLSIPIMQQIALSIIKSALGLS